MASYPDSSARATQRATVLSNVSSPPSANVETTAISLTRIGALIAQLMGDATLRELLGAEGYPKSELQAGMALHVAAEEQFNACERTQAACDALVARRNVVWIKAQREFILFRTRVALPGQIQSGPSLRAVRARRQTVAAFVAEAESAYSRQGSRRYAILMAKYGFGPARIRLARELLRLLQTLDGEVREMRIGLQRLHDARAVSLVMLNHWLQELFKHLRVAFGQTRHPPHAKAHGETGDKTHPAPKRRRTPDC